MPNLWNELDKVIEFQELIKITIVLCIGFAGGFVFAKRKKK